MQNYSKTPLLHHSNTRFLLQPVSLLLMCACDSVPSMTTTNPFPGMNPFFEQQWQDAHTMLIAYLRDALQERLPADLTARAEEEAASIGAGERATTYRPDVQVREPWTLKEPAVAGVTPPLPAAPATEPIRVFLDDEAVERWLEIRDTTGRLITLRLNRWAGGVREGGIMVAIHDSLHALREQEPTRARNARFIRQPSARVCPLPDESGVPMRRFMESLVRLAKAHLESI